MHSTNMIPLKVLPSTCTISLTGFVDRLCLFLAQVKVQQSEGSIPKPSFCNQPLAERGAGTWYQPQAD